MKRGENQVIRRRSYKRGYVLDGSFRSYAPNTALRLFVTPQFKSDTKQPAEMRAFMQKCIEGRAKFAPGTRHRENTLGRVPSHWFRAGKGDARGALLYLHGGAFVVETPRAHGAFEQDAYAAGCTKLAMVYCTASAYMATVDLLVSRLRLSFHAMSVLCCYRKVSSR